MLWVTEKFKNFGNKLVNKIYFRRKEYVEIALNLISFGFNIEHCLVDPYIFHSAGLDRIDNARNGNACRTKGGNREILQTPSILVLFPWPGYIVE